MSKSARCGKVRAVRRRLAAHESPRADHTNDFLMKEGTVKTLVFPAETWSGIPLGAAGTTAARQNAQKRERHANITASDG